VRYGVKALPGRQGCFKLAALLLPCPTLRSEAALPARERYHRCMTERRFPAPWSAEPQPNYYVVRDADGQQLAYVYFENEPGRRSAAKLLTKDGGRRIAANIAKLPDLLRGIERRPGECSNARNSHYSRPRLSGDCRSPMVGLSLTR